MPVRRLLFLLLPLLASVLFFPACRKKPAAAALPPPTFPGEKWKRKEPAELGMAPAPLASLATLVGGNGFVVRRGYLVHSWGDPGTGRYVASALKPVLSSLLMLAVQEGKLPSVDAMVADFEPRLRELNNGKDAGITWRHLASQTSGYGLSEPPGAAFAYNDPAIALYYDTLTQGVFKDTGSSLLASRLGRPLGFQDEYNYQAYGPTGPDGKLRISARDFCRFGLLILNHGTWAGKEIIRPDLVTLMTTSTLPPDLPRAAETETALIAGQRSIGGGRNDCSIGPGYYTFNWWRNTPGPRKHRQFPALPEDTLLASGLWGRRVLWVIPSLELVLAWNESEISDHRESPYHDDTKMNEAARLIRASIPDGKKEK